LEGYGYTPQNIAQLTQLGYPVALDGGLLMQRTDSYGFVDGNASNNTVIGSLQTGGSSGGPWLVNFGIKPALSGTAVGAHAQHGRQRHQLGLYQHPGEATGSLALHQW
jgi:hypothetical protein